MRIGVDAMGGDFAPAEQVKGAVAARDVLEGDDRIVLVGDEELLRSKLAESNGWNEYIDVVHAGEVIGMSESPVEALRSKPDSSIARMAQMQREGQIEAYVSAGNTGACVAAAQMRLRRLRGVHRPGIAIVTPTPKGPVALCDVGANVNCRPQHLHQYALMAGLYLSTAYGIESPRVGLLNIGAEEAKGTDLVRQARELLSTDSRVNFIGNVEGRDLFSGVCDVMVCEGFVGNVVLKIMEGMAEGIVRSLIAEMSQAMPSHAELLQGAALKLMAKYDYNEYGGAPLLGVDGICIICHGSSDYRGIMNAVRVAKVFARQRLNDQIIQALSEN